MLSRLALAVVLVSPFALAVATFLPSVATAQEPAVAAPGDATAEQALTPETMATAEKPPGFRYGIVRGGLVESLAGTLLYVKTSKDAKTSTAVPVPKDPALLAKTISGGTPADLIKGTVVDVKFDPRGVVRPEIAIVSRSTIEVLDDAKIMDRGGNKLYVVTAAGKSRGFELAGEGAAAWTGVVTNGTPDDLKPGTLVRIAYDPSGQEPLQVTLKATPKPAQDKDKGCGCQVAGGPRNIPLGGSWAAIGALAMILTRRRRA